MHRILRIHGRVQGVGFRASLAREADRLGIAGWVRNRRDGSVEAFVSGTPAAIDTLLAWAHRGPPAARVTRVEATPAEAAPASAGADCTGFEMRPSA